MKLELKHLAPYLPYNVPCLYACIMDANNDTTIPMNETNIHRVLNGYGSFVIKPILRPLSDLKKEINMDGEMVSTYEILPTREREDYENPLLGYWSWNAMQILFMNHFDVFGLIEKGLAIDINTLK